MSLEEGFSGAGLQEPRGSFVDGVPVHGNGIE